MALGDVEIQQHVKAAMEYLAEENPAWKQMKLPQIQQALDKILVENFALPEGSRDQVVAAASQQLGQPSKQVAGFVKSGKVRPISRGKPAAAGGSKITPPPAKEKPLVSNKPKGRSPLVGKKPKAPPVEKPKIPIPPEIPPSVPPTGGGGTPDVPPRLPPSAPKGFLARNKGKLGLLGAAAWFAPTIMDSVRETVTELMPSRRARAEEAQLKQAYDYPMELQRAAMPTLEDRKVAMALQREVETRAAMIAEKNPSYAQILMGLPPTTANEIITGGPPADPMKMRQAISDQVRQEVENDQINLNAFLK